MRLMEWSGLYSMDDVKVEMTPYGFLDIEVDRLDIHSAVEDALIELYLNFEGKKLITLEINHIILILDRFDNPHNPMFQVFGRKYKAGSDVFLKPSQPLGNVSTQQWSNYVSFCQQMYPLVQCWMDTLP